MEALFLLALVFVALLRGRRRYVPPVTVNVIVDDRKVIVDGDDKRLLEHTR